MEVMQEVTPSPVDWSDVRCGEREECPDINMVCGPTFTCQCRQVSQDWEEPGLISVPGHEVEPG